MSGGAHPVWRGDGRELYYWKDNALIAVPIDTRAGTAVPIIGASTVLFHAPYYIGPNTMYDVSPDGARFVIVSNGPPAREQRTLGLASAPDQHLR